ncbi:MAG: glycosyltransferase [Elusimicrobiota bacterium]
MEPSRITAIVPTHRRPLLLNRCLTSLLAEKDSGLIQILIVVHEDDPEGARIAEDWTRRDQRVQRTYTRSLSRSIARNEAAPLAVGDWLYFLDDDATVLPGALAALQSAISLYPDSRAIGGPNLLPEDSGAFETAVDAVLTSPLGAGTMRARYIDGGRDGAVDERSLIACNLAVEKTSFLEHRFDERLDYGEETLLLARMRLAGLGLVRENAMRVRHRRRADWFSFARQTWRSGRGRARQTLVLPGSLPAECFAPPLLPVAALLTVWVPETCFLFLAYAAACAAVGGLFYARRRDAAAALWSVIVIPTGHAAYGLGFWAELIAAAGRIAAPRGVRRALADWAAGRPLHGMMSVPFAAYYAAAEASVRLWARASGQPISDLNVHRGYSGPDWRPGISDIDLTAVWCDPGLVAESAALERWARGYNRLRRIFPVLGETIIADEASWRRYHRHGDFRAQNVADTTPEENARRSIDRWTEQLHGAICLTRAYLDEPAGPRRSRTAVKSFLDVVRHGGEGGTPPAREAAMKGLESDLARIAARAAADDGEALAGLCAESARLLDARARVIAARLPEAGTAVVTAGIPAPRAAQEAESAIARLGAAVGRPKTAVFDSTLGAWLVFPRLADGDDSAGFWNALKSFKRQDPAYAGTVFPLTETSLRLLAWSAYAEDPLKTLAWRSAVPAAASGCGPLLSRHVVAIVGAEGLPPVPPQALAESLLRESAALLLLHWRGRLTGPDAASPLDLWTRFYGRTLAVRAWLEEGKLFPSFPLEPLARRHALRHPKDSAWIEDRVLGATALDDRTGDLRFLGHQMRELARLL